ncbi:hypothetical protein V499_08086 [Pseudogymnoascus sp. VKM F-103]|nr:hypothetical protein V499_08086 [Pseudogymnoascus sp. VKM F-103]
MHFTQTLTLLLLPLLAITSPTLLEAADDITTLDTRTGINLGALKVLQHRLFTAHNQITNIDNDLVGPSNNVANQLPGAAGASFRAALERYHAEQGRANADLVKLEKGLGAYVEAANHHERTDRKFWGRGAGGEE